MSISKPVIVFDLDEVLFPFMQNFLLWYNKREQTNYQLDSVIQYNFSDSWPITREKIKQEVLIFSKEMDLLDVKPLSGSEESIKTLSFKYDLIIVTARNQEMQTQTEKWLDMWFPKMFSQIYFTGHFFDQTPKNKAYYCGQVKAKAVIDDSISNCNECLSLEDLRIYLFGNYPWNQSNNLDPKITRLLDWPALVQEFV
jgi:5'(3')-deoxyribonucleotidase